jgi:hypothetical protein
LWAGGTPADPVLTLVSRYNLPTRWGHDLSACTTDSDLMWVSTNGGTYIFNKTNGGFRAVAGDAQGTFVKGISDQPTGGTPSDLVTMMPIRMRWLIGR